MDKNQISKNNMYGKAETFFANPTFSAMWAGFTILQDEITAFGTKKEKLDEYIIQQQVSTTGVTEDKTAEMKTAEKMAAKLARKAKVWAKKAENDTLKVLFSTTKSQLGKMTVTSSIAKMTEISTALNAQATPLAAYNITSANITTLSTAIASADTLKGTTGTAKASKVAGTEGIETKMSEIDKILTNVDDLLIPEYEDGTEAEVNMVNEYKNNRKIDNIGHFATILEAAITDAISNDKLQNITMSIIELNKAAISDINGIAAISRFKAGEYHIKFTGAGYLTQIIIVKIKRGKKVEMAVKMVAIAV